MSFISAGYLMAYAALGTAGAGIAGEMGAFGSPDQIQYNAPDYYLDPMYQKTQDQLFPYASSLLTGQGLPSAYQDLIQPNSPQFQTMLNNVTANTLSGVQQNMAAQGIQDSGIANSAAAGAIGTETSQLTYQDFLNSQANQLQLMGLGLNTMGNLSSNALTQSGMKNTFNLENAAASAGYGLQNINLQNQAASNWGNMVGGGLNSMANLYGTNQLSSAIKGLNNTGLGVGGYSNILGNSFNSSGLTLGNAGLGAASTGAAGTLGLNSSSWMASPDLLSSLNF